MCGRDGRHDMRPCGRRPAGASITGQTDIQSATHNAAIGPHNNKMNIYSVLLVILRSQLLVESTAYV